LVPPQQPLTLARAITRLLDDRSLAAQLGAAARRRVLVDYTPERRTRVLSNLYAALAGVRAETDAGYDRCADPTELRVG
jgi:glycosyltransferase involved in cell wall biosynthesis